MTARKAAHSLQRAKLGRVWSPEVRSCDVAQIHGRISEGNVEASDGRIKR